MYDLKIIGRTPNGLPLFSYWEDGIGCREHFIEYWTGDAVALRIVARTAF